MITPRRIIVTVLLCLPVLLAPDVCAAGLDDWFERESGITNDLFGIAFAAAKFVAVGSAGCIILSSNAIAWHSAPIDLTNRLCAVTHGNGHFVAAGEGVVMVSSNATDWTISNQPNLFLRGIAYGGGRFVAVGSIFTGSNDLAVSLSSTNGVDWQSHEMGVINEPTGGAFGDEMFVAVTKFNKDVLLSTNGADWLRAEIPCYNPRNAVTFGQGQFVAVGSEPYCPSFPISVSPDGIHWQDRQAGVDDAFFGITFGANTFVAVGGLFDVFAPKSRILSSRDALNWTSRPVPTSNDLEAVTFGNVTFVAVGKSGTIVQSGNTGDVMLSASRNTAGTAMLVTVIGQSNWVYRLQASTNLNGFNWQDVVVVTNAHNGFTFTDALDSPSRQRYYRVVSP